MNVQRAGEPVGFWKFLILTSITLAVVRAMLFDTPISRATSNFPASFVLYFVYRYARTQVWWPFGGAGTPNADSESVAQEAYRQPMPQPREQAYEPIGKTLKKPIDSEYLKSLAQKKKDKKRGGANPPPPVPSQYARTGINTGDKAGAHGSAFKKPLSRVEAAAKLLTSTVGERSKTVRYKSQRTKTLRSKRQSSPVPI